MKDDRVLQSIIESLGISDRKLPPITYKDGTISRLISVPEEQQEFIKRHIRQFEKFSEDTTYQWERILNIICGKDDRYLPNWHEYDFDTDITLWAKENSENESNFKLFNDGLNILLYDLQQHEYYEACQNCNDMMNRIDMIGNWIDEETGELW